MLTLRSPSITAAFSAIGARLLSCVVDGVETVFGSGSDEDVLSGDIYAGAICGRHAGRISNAQFTLDGETVRLTANAGPHQLHGGTLGFHRREWVSEKRGDTVVFTLHSQDGDEGFPGAMDVTASYRLAGPVLSLEINATTTNPTVANITNHAYWNLAGGGDVLGHELMIPARKYFPLNNLLLPLGFADDVAGTRWDFRKLHPIAEDYDNCFLLDGRRGEMKHGLKLRDPKSGRTLDVWASENCVQMYTAIHWQPSMIGRHGPLRRSTAFAIEPQNVADAPNHPALPSSILRPSETYCNRMEWRFS